MGQEKYDKKMREKIKIKKNAIFFNTDIFIIIS